MSKIKKAERKAKVFKIYSKSITLVLGGLAGLITAIALLLKEL